MAFETLLLEVADGIAVATLNRPEKLNSFNHVMRREFRTLSDDLHLNQDIKVVIVTGQGRAFCAGADIEFFEHDWSTPMFRREYRLVHDFFDDLEQLEKPVIAAINGICAGGGLELALACDYRIAVEGARFGFSENQLALIPASGGCSRLPRFVGMGRAKDLLLTGRMIEADEAERIGLVDRVVKAGQAMSEARGLAQQLLKKALPALGLLKQAVVTCSSVDLDSGRIVERLTQSVLIKTRDHQEGIKAFREKRPAQFMGR